MPPSAPTYSAAAVARLGQVTTKTAVAYIEDVGLADARDPISGHYRLTIDQACRVIEAMGMRATIADGQIIVSGSHVRSTHDRMPTRLESKSPTISRGEFGSWGHRSIADIDFDNSLPRWKS